MGDEGVVLSASSDGTARIWRAGEDGVLTSAAVLTEHTAEVNHRTEIAANGAATVLFCFCLEACAEATAGLVLAGMAKGKSCMPGPQSVAFCNYFVCVT